MTGLNPSLTTQDHPDVAAADIEPFGDLLVEHIRLAPETADFAHLLPPDLAAPVPFSPRRPAIAATFSKAVGDVILLSPDE